MHDDLLRPTIGADPDRTQPPWRLLGQTYVAFFGGAIATTVIAVLNARRLGMPARGRAILIALGVAGLVVVIAVALWIDREQMGGGQIATRLAAAACCLAQLRVQRPLDRAFQLRGREYASLWAAGVTAAICGGIVEQFLIAMVVNS
jgi:hypothetical protein